MQQTSTLVCQLQSDKVVLETQLLAAKNQIQLLQDEVNHNREVVQNLQSELHDNIEHEKILDLQNQQLQKEINEVSGQFKEFISRKEMDKSQKITIDHAIQDELETQLARMSQ